jgi:hypothetical protein
MKSNQFLRPLSAPLSWDSGGPPRFLAALTALGGAGLILIVSLLVGPTQADHNALVEEALHRYAPDRAPAPGQEDGHNPGDTCPWVGGSGPTDKRPPACPGRNNAAGRKSYRDLV